LAEIGPLAGDLEGEVLVAEVLFAEGRVAVELRGFVLGDEVVDYAPDSQRVRCVLGSSMALNE
jgi:hypothetical protein